MCGRYAMALSAGELQHTLEDFGLEVKHVKNEDGCAQSLNIAPQSRSLVYCADPGSRAPGLVGMRWTLQPSFASEPVKYPTFNTRSDSLRPLKPAFRCATERRGIVFMQGYYEWQHSARKRLPFYMSSPDSKLLCCLVIWDSNPRLGLTYSIVTTEAAPQLQSVHERMPVIVDVDAAKRWVAGPWPDVLDVITSNRKLKSHRVGTDVNKVGATGKGLNKPLKQITEWFPAGANRRNRGPNAGASDRATGLAGLKPPGKGNAHPSDPEQTPQGAPPQ